MYKKTGSSIFLVFLNFLFDSFYFKPFPAGNSCPKLPGSCGFFYFRILLLTVETPVKIMKIFNISVKS